MTDLARTFAAHFAGAAIVPDDQRYEAARAVWNATVEARPALIAQCRTVADIAAAVNLTRDAGLPFAVRGGGHSVAGLSTCDGGVVIDLSPMRSVAVDSTRGVAIAQPGATWGDYDAATGRHGLGSPGGASTPPGRAGGHPAATGVAGLARGGGIGWLQRRCGLACDNLIGVELVPADGATVRVNQSERPDLLWGLRGGGGNFGIVSRFEFSLHPVTTVLGGLMLFPIDQGPDVLRTFRDWAADLPDEGSMLAALLTAPPEPFVPSDLVGQKSVAILGCWCGDLEDGATTLEPLRRLKPAADVFGPLPYPDLQRMLDAGAPAGLRNYFRGGYLSELTDDVIDVVLEQGATMPSPMSAIHLHQMGGAVGRVGVDATAFSGRAAAYTYNLVSTWSDAAEDTIHMAANQRLAAALAPLSLRS